MYISNCPNVELKTDGDDSGFTLPFVLTLLVVLSITSIILIERVLNAQNLARFDINSTNQQINSYKIEQDIVWRALLELNGVADDLTASLGPQSKNYRALEPENKWLRSGEPAVWSGNYNYNENYFSADSDIKIEIRDVGGLIDINYANENYLLYIAERLGVPLASRRVAVKSLQEELDNLSERVDDESIFIQPLFTGLSDAAEICSIEGWSKIELCRNHQELREIVYAGFGNITNIDLASKQVRDILLQASNTDNLQKVRQRWREIQKDSGFNDVFANSVPGLEAYIVTFHYSDGKSKQYLLDARIQPSQKPYALYLLHSNIAQNK